VSRNGAGRCDPGEHGRPATALGRADIGVLEIGATGDASVLELTEGDFDYRGVLGEVRSGRRRSKRRDSSWRERGGTRRGGEGRAAIFGSLAARPSQGARRRLSTPRARRRFRNILRWRRTASAFSRTRRSTAFRRLAAASSHGKMPSRCIFSLALAMRIDVVVTYENFHQRSSFRRVGLYHAGEAKERQAGERLLPP